jgi:hypothetical protein
VRRALCNLRPASCSMRTGADRGRRASQQAGWRVAGALLLMVQSAAARLKPTGHWPGAVREILVERSTGCALRRQVLPGLAVNDRRSCARRRRPPHHSRSGRRPPIVSRRAGRDGRPAAAIPPDRKSRLACPNAPVCGLKRGRSMLRPATAQLTTRCLTGCPSVVRFTLQQSAAARLPQQNTSKNAVRSPCRRLQGRCPRGSPRARQPQPLHQGDGLQGHPEDPQR